MIANLGFDFVPAPLQNQERESGGEKSDREVRPKFENGLKRKLQQQLFHANEGAANVEWPSAFDLQFLAAVNPLSSSSPWLQC